MPTIYNIKTTNYGFFKETNTSASKETSEVDAQEQQDEEPEEKKPTVVIVSESHKEEEKPNRSLLRELYKDDPHMASGGSRQLRCRF